MFERVVEAVAFAHAQGVVHRDLKPANIMVGRFGEVLVMDWGVARLLAGEAPQADAGVTRVGTPGFMPEQSGGGGVGADGPASDVYGLGAILQWLLVPAARVPRRLRAIAAKCLAQEPAGRYPNAAALAATSPGIEPVKPSKRCLRPSSNRALRFRLFGRESTLARALRELEALAPTTLERTLALPLVLAFRRRISQNDFEARDMHAYQELMAIYAEIIHEAEEKGLEQGIREGRVEGERAILVRLLARRFGPLPEAALERIRHAELATLERWTDRLLSARTLDEVLA